MNETTDYGPAFVRDHKGNLATWGGAAEVEIAERLDPSRPDRGRTPPTVRGARRYDGVGKMLGEHSDEFRAAERFRADSAYADGARDQAAAIIARAGFDPSRYGPGDTQLDAMTRAMAAWRAVGSDLAYVVIWCILGNGSLRTFAERYHVSQTTAAAQFHAAIGMLVEHYDAVDG